MLVSNKPRRAVSQAPPKETTCHAGCGATVHFRTTPRIVCAECKPAYRREQVRLSAERQRRKRSIPEVKGSRIACRGCGVDVVLNRSTRAKYCERCALEASRERARNRVRRLCAERGAPKIGARDNCRHCGSEFTRAGPRNFLCAPCGEKSVRRSLTEEQKDKARSYKRRWSNGDGKDKAKGYQRQSRTRRKANPAFTINERMSASVRQSLTLGKQGYRWESLVGFTLADLMAHLEAQFLPGMTWDNRGEWHIDHIRPLCSFEFQTPECSQFREAWALSNLRPLWAQDNLKKGGRWAA